MSERADTGIAGKRSLAPPPIAMLAELTHRCPLACPYCSNPLELTQSHDELATEEWIDAFRQAAALGVLHLHLSGGEPAARRDLAALTEAAASLGLYTNLITSGIGLTQPRIVELADAGLDHIQLSIQGSTPEMADHVGDYKGGYARKLAVAGWVRETGIPLTVNAVCHKQNMDQIGDMIATAVELGARRIEVATVQFHGWAEKNRMALMPTREQVKRATALVEAARKTLDGILVIDYVPADHHSRYPKACMGGWGRTGLNIAPSGRVLPCHAAETIPLLVFDNVRDRPLADIWHHGSAFNAYRGEDWMLEPCRSCARKHIDYGGCRCQAMALAGRADATDPICTHSPLHDGIAARAEEDGIAVPPAFVYRGRP
ncbi:pyrroloquinoline quinone biosynthesis protein PqqE [Rhizobium sp. BK602]|uniref:pyrroloquinoline quinone biosynthesis protein PqqE n=1 Tax=Rhizobium sp. BK602 TaxID=2586986 RepID=UPI0016201DD6|nr:pyrroloquinoline quinone biosynthesis protein PqqE [Rhizobium sp. BK602]MBB3609580.1 pyrroloquinoline quinone biosynthesis protein E [Rhizobium sp. BK602]